MQSLKVSQYEIGVRNNRGIGIFFVEDRAMIQKIVKRLQEVCARFSWPNSSGRRASRRQAVNMGVFAEALRWGKAFRFCPDPTMEKIVQPAQWVNFHVGQRITVSCATNILKPLGYGIDRLHEHPLFETHHVPKLDQEWGVDTIGYYPVTFDFNIGFRERSVDHPLNVRKPMII